jgi:Leucine-rich repeat (LRR) protein
LCCAQAREAIVSLEGFGSAASQSSKLGVLKSGLVFIYEGLDGPSWRDQGPGWAPRDRQRSVSSWLGVVIAEGLFVGLKLTHNNLKGEVGVALAKLAALESLGGVSALQELNLASNALTGSLAPRVIASFTSLMVFCTPFNRLSGEIPSTFSDCEALAVLNLQGNALSGRIPPSLGLCTNLRVVHLYSNDLSGPLPVELAALDKLIELRLWDNRLTGPIPAEYGALSRLKVLHLANNLLTGEVPMPTLFSASSAHL